MKKKGKSCVHLFARKNVCYVTLSRGKYRYSKELGTSARGDVVIVDYDARRRVIGIELIGDGKPCQRSVA